MLLSIGSAHASTIAVTGSYSFSYKSSVGNAPTINDVLGNPFTVDLALNTPTSVTNFISVAPASFCGLCGFPGTATGTITATFILTEPSGATGKLSDTATYTADYYNDMDSVTWSSTNDPIVVDFTDGAVMDVTLGNASDWTIYPTITFDLTKNPTLAPEPMSLALLGAGLFGLGIVRRSQRA